jgi:protocatechuate 3,4-dioxygenase beta subunit
MAMTRRSVLRLFLGLGGTIVGAGAASLVWFQRKLDPRTPIEGPLPGVAWASGTLPPTPACDDGDADPTEGAAEGPFYRPNTPERKVLREAGIPGTPLVLTGRVLAPDCRPLAGAVLDFWSCDGRGVYDTEGFKLRGHQLTDASGAYRLETVKPSDYRQNGLHRTPHIHVKVQGRGTRLLTTQLFFPGEPLNDQDYLVRDSLLIDLARSGGGSLTGRFDFVLA